MKNFNSLQELWEYCLFCPLCQDNCRSIDISVGPDTIFSTLSFKKNNEFLRIKSSADFHKIKENKYQVNNCINTITGKFTTDILHLKMNEDQSSYEEDRPFFLIEKSYFYFYINAFCRECNTCYLNSTDIQLNYNDNFIDNIGIEREGVYIIHPHGKYHLSILYDSNKTLINKVSIDKENNQIIEDNRIFECPIVDFDLSNLKKTINKIKTYIMFS